MSLLQLSERDGCKGLGCVGGLLCTIEQLLLCRRRRALLVVQCPALYELERLKLLGCCGTHCTLQCFASGVLASFNRALA